MTSFVADEFHDFFGDHKCSGAVYEKYRSGDIYRTIKGCTYGDFGEHGPTWHWGYRHWVFILMGICLFIVSVVRVVNIVEEK